MGFQPISAVIAVVMADYEAKQDAYRRHRLAHAEQWFQSNAEDFCARTGTDPQTGKWLEDVT